MFIIWYQYYTFYREKKSKVSGIKQKKYVDNNKKKKIKPNDLQYNLDSQSNPCHYNQHDEQSILLVRKSRYRRDYSFDF